MTHPLQARSVLLTETVERFRFCGANGAYPGHFPSAWTRPYGVTLDGGAAGNTIALEIKGTATVEVGLSGEDSIDIAIGDEVISGLDGKANMYFPGAYVCGIALTAGSSGDFIEVALCDPYQKGGHTETFRQSDPASLTTLALWRAPAACVIKGIRAVCGAAPDGTQTYTVMVLNGATASQSAAITLNSSSVAGTFQAATLSDAGIILAAGDQLNLTTVHNAGNGSALANVCVQVDVAY